MAGSENLFLLIKSLSKAEKRFFKLQSSRVKGEKNYLKLFDLIDAQSIYNEEAIRIQFTGTRAYSRFPREKNQLYELILKAMCVYQYQKHIVARVDELIGSVRFLFEKGLYKQSSKTLKKAEKIARKYELHLKLLEIVDWKKKLFEQGIYSNVQQTAKAIKKEQENGLLAYNNLAKYSLLYDQLTLHRLVHGRIRKDEELERVKSILKQPELENIKHASSFKAEYLFLHTHYNYYELTGNWDKAIIYSKKLVELLEESPLQQELHYKEYISIYYLHLKSMLREAQFDAYNSDWSLREMFYVGIKKFKQLPKTNLYRQLKSESLDEWYLTHYYHIHFNYYAHIMAFEKVVSMTKEIEEFLSKRKKVQTIDNSIFAVNLSIAHFLLGEFKVANKWLNRVLNSKLIDARSDLYSFARIIGLMIHYEIGNYGLIDYMSKSAYRFLNKLNMFHKVERTLYVFMKNKAVYLNTPKKKKEAFTKLHQELEALSKDPKEKRVFEVFNFLSWTESHLENKSIHETYIQRHKKWLEEQNIKPI